MLRESVNKRGENRLRSPKENKRMRLNPCPNLKLYHYGVRIVFKVRR